MATSVEYIAVSPRTRSTGTCASRTRGALYLPSSEGLHEVVRLSGSRGRTWFRGDHVSRGDVLVHAPFDAFFLAVPIALSLIPAERTEGAGPFQPLGDLLASAAGSGAWALRPAFAPTAPPDTWNKDMGRLVELPPFVRAFEACCERKVIPGALPSPPPEAAGSDGATGKGERGESAERGETYFRPSRGAILGVLRRKVAHVVSHADAFDHLVRALGRDGLQGAEPALIAAAKQRAAIDTLAAYLPPALVADLAGEYDFAELDAHLAERAAAAAPVVPEKKEKAAAGSKRKAASQGSRGVEALKKVNTAGMAKMTSFFKPKT